MTEFIDFWHMYAPLSEFKNRYQCSEKVWNAMDEEKRQLIMLGLEKEQMERSPPVHKKNPYFYLLDWQPPKQQTLSFADYYAKYHTTEEQDGWHMENPTGQQVIYVKS